jgi:hypothetical protein
MRIGRFLTLLPWIGTMLLSATIAHVAETALASGGQPAVVTGCQTPPAELTFSPLPMPDDRSPDLVYVHGWKLSLNPAWPAQAGNEVESKYSDVVAVDPHNVVFKMKPSVVHPLYVYGLPDV